MGAFGVTHVKHVFNFHLDAKDDSAKTVITMVKDMAEKIMLATVKALLDGENEPDKFSLQLQQPYVVLKSQEDFINMHQLVLLVFVLIDEASGIGICCIGIPAFEIRSPWLQTKVFICSALRHYKIDNARVVVMIDEVIKRNDLTTSGIRKYSSSIRLLHDPFISSNVGPVNNLEVRVSTLSRFITNAEKSRGVSISSLNDSRRSSIWAKDLSQG
ncbi:hypothetical protein Tco_0900248 [Tanacetum coccineum]